MNKVQAASVAFCAITLCLLAGCASSETRSDATGSSQPSNVVQSIFVDRVKSEKTFESGGDWQLNELRPYFSEGLQAKISAYRDQKESFYRRYAKYELSVGRLDNYLTLIQFDPITTCNRAAAHAKVRQIERTKEGTKFHVTYRIFGTDAFYDRDVIVTLGLINGQWLITDVQYLRPGFVAPLDHIRSMDDSLAFLTQELHASSIWAAQHRNELVPNGIFHAGRGPFDRP